MSNGGKLTRADLDNLKERLLFAAESPPAWTAFCSACRKPFQYAQLPPFDCPNCGVTVTELVPV